MENKRYFELCRTRLQFHVCITRIGTRELEICFRSDTDLPPYDGRSERGTDYFFVNVTFAPDYYFFPSISDSSNLASWSDKYLGDILGRFFESYVCSWCLQQVSLLPYLSDRPFRAVAEFSVVGRDLLVLPAFHDFQ